MQFKQSLLAAVYFAVFAVAAPLVDLTVGNSCGPAVANPSGPSSPPLVGVSVGDVAGSGDGGLPGGSLGEVLSGVGLGLGGVVPGLGSILSSNDGAPAIPGPKDPQDPPTWGAGESSDPSASAGVSASIGGSPAPSAPTSVLPISTNLATSVSVPTSALPVSTNHATSASAPASAPQPTPAPSGPGSPNSPEQPSGSNSGGYGGGSSTCSTGPVQCCNSVQESDTPAAQNAIGLLDIPIGGVTGLVGLTCSPILGTLSSSSCSAQTVCCEDNSYGSAISIGCLPVTL